MKTLYIIRHAKSSWKDINLSDIERPLKKRGIENAREGAALLWKEEVKPDLMITSPAVRAHNTATIFADKLGIPREELQVMEKLYLPDFSTLLKIVLYTPDTCSRLMLFGHEPSLSTLINHFLENKLEKVVTSSITTLQFDTESWKEISAACLAGGSHRSRHNWEGDPIG